MIESIKNKKKRIASIISILKDEYPDSKCSLIFNSPFQLLVATVLSAQCTDERVNKVTKTLFKRYPDSESFSSLGNSSQTSHGLGSLSQALRENFSRLFGSDCRSAALHLQDELSRRNTMVIRNLTRQLAK